ncbi:hypothetical protein VTK73DRAFT_5326 [Phialemonium thermophilum]|uniref:Uncharacterized protein n=1 Tax=Phialemonium thermophilum TaxID=223376 RepID=A0ABR3Y890_9PEZI
MDASRCTASLITPHTQDQGSGVWLHLGEGYPIRRRHMLTRRPKWPLFGFWCHFALGCASCLDRGESYSTIADASTLPLELTGTT